MLGMCHIRDTTWTPDVCLPSLERCGVSEGGAWHKGSGIGSASRSRTSHALSARRPGSCAARTRVPEHPSTEERGASSVVAYLFWDSPSTRQRHWRCSTVTFCSACDVRRSWWSRWRRRPIEPRANELRLQRLCMYVLKQALHSQGGRCRIQIADGLIAGGWRYE